MKVPTRVGVALVAGLVAFYFFMVAEALFVQPRVRVLKRGAVPTRSRFEPWRWEPAQLPRVRVVHDRGEP